MARRGGDGGGMSAGPMNTIIAGFVGLLVIVAIVILGPVLAGSIEEAVPALDAESDWNATHNTDLPTGTSIWSTNVVIGGVVIQMLRAKKWSLLRNINSDVNGFVCKLGLFASNFVKSSSSSPWLYSSQCTTLYRNVVTTSV